MVNESVTQQGTVVAAFSGTGKTFVAARYPNVLELDVGTFRFIDDAPADIPFEARKAMKSYEINPKWPKNYIDALRSGLKSYQMVLTVHTPELDDFGVEYARFVPKESAWDILEQRFRDRGNPERFIQIQKLRFQDEKQLAEYESNYIIDDNEYLEDALVRCGFLKG